MKYDKHSQVNENRKRIIDQQRKTSKALSAKLVPLDLNADLGIRKQDCFAFTTAAKTFNNIILVRDTNKWSLQYIGKDGFVPKPIDCKMKTADCNAYIPSIGRQSLTAGLVVDPGLVGAKAFASDSKIQTARKEWSKFLGNKYPGEIDNKVFSRRGKDMGFFAVDTYPDSERYGCLMLSEQNIPVRGFDRFDLSREECQPWKRTHMKYIHADYDLYATIDPESPNAHSLKNIIHNEENIFSKDCEAISEFVNSWVGAPVIQHGEQFHLFHKDDTLYAFYPTGGMYRLVNASAQTIADIFEVLYGVDA